ncbi:hypothetical protein GCM10020367_69000 [Streptomyces sannanensis]|uniref:RNA-directed DNA polymerase n=1 Tax=Streptomyces sannanensis TaxID=285536 RepID=A0ABP6SN40_9ACTN
MSRADNTTPGQGKGRCFVDAQVVWRGLVSATSASSATSGSLKLDPVRALQHALYRAAKADPGRRFHALGDKVHRRDVLRRAWATVRRNNGAPGIDATTLVQVEEYGIDRLLDELAAEIRRAAGVRCPRAGCSSRSPAQPRNRGRCRSLPSATASCRPR